MLLGAAAPTLRAAQPATGVIDGVVTTQGTVRLPGAQLTVLNAEGIVVAEVMTGGAGEFSVPIAAGRYAVRAALTGFVTTSVTVDVRDDNTSVAAIDLAIEGITQTVEVTAEAGPLSTPATIATSESIGGREMDQLAPSGGLQSSLRLLASIIQVPSGVSIKGGRPNQAGLQLGPGTLTDPALGLSPFMLPDDAIDSVAVLPNPYAVEYGRFSSGLVVIQTRRAGDEWKVRLNDIDPTFRTKRGSAIDPVGVGWWGPRVEIGGPVLRDRLFLEQTAQYRYSAGDVPSRPQDELRVSKSFSSFTRLDGTLAPRHSFVATIGTYPNVASDATLGTFTPPNATVDVHTHANELGATERAVWSDRLFGETTVQAHDYASDVVPQGTAPMQLLPETTLGNFFNQQHRDTGAYQLISSLAFSENAWRGLHLFKVGIDVLGNRYDGSSVSRDVEIERSDGTLARRLAFASVPSEQTDRSIDLALFAQDRYQINTRWNMEFGVRLDRDGVLERFNATPRIGTAISLNADGTSVLRGGFGLFYERTPSIAGAFDQFETFTDVRYAADGITPLTEPQVVVHETSPHLKTPRSRTWDVAYDLRLNKRWSFHLGAIARHGTHEMIVTTAPTTTGASLMLSSSGRSDYRDVDVSIHYARSPRADITATYARSLARADLNALSAFFDTVLSPVVGANQFAAANTDVPNRVLARGRVMPTDRWLLIGIFDWRSGLPYSLVNDTLDFVGARNSLRFPTYARLEAGIEHRFKVLKFQPWIGVRVWNALNSFLPTDVQSNIGSPAFGSFYNSEYRQFRIQVRFER
jgi:carboxypeptidase family protein/TonB-dependent receptor-like protein